MTPANPDALADALARVTAERDEARADLKAAEDSNDALNVKLHTLAPHGSCACSYDKPGDVCMHHSPALAAAEARAAQLQAEVEALREALTDARDLVRQSLKNGAPGLTETTREAVVRSIMLKLEGKVLAARAATAKEGQADVTELERLRKENKELQTQLDALVQEVLGG